MWRLQAWVTGEILQSLVVWAAMDARCQMLHTSYMLAKQGMVQTLGLGGGPCRSTC